MDVIDLSRIKLTRLQEVVGQERMRWFEEEWSWLKVES
jgi:hypothetical protein